MEGVRELYGFVRFDARAGEESAVEEAWRDVTGYLQEEERDETLGESTTIGVVQEKKLYNRSWKIVATEQSCPLGQAKERRKPEKRG